MSCSPHPLLAHSNYTDLAKSRRPPGMEGSCECIAKAAMCSSNLGLGVGLTTHRKK
jgi:hypothetical protein